MTSLATTETLFKLMENLNVLAGKALITKQADNVDFKYLVPAVVYQALLFVLGMGVEVCFC